MAVGVLRFWTPLAGGLLVSRLGSTHVVRLWARAGKVKQGIALFTVNGDFELQAGTVVEEVFSLEWFSFKALADFAEEVAHSALGGVHDRTHVKLYRLETLLVDELVDQHRATVARGDLGMEVRDVLWG